MKFHVFSNIYFVVCKCFQFGPVLNFAKDINEQFFFPETYFSDPEESLTARQDRGVNTEPSLLYRPRAQKVGRRPPWKKYWRADPGLPITNSRQGPFRETALQAPFEARNQRPTHFISM